MQIDTAAKLITFEQARILLGVTRVTIYKMLERRDLIPILEVKRGKQTRRFFMHNDVIAVKDKRTYPPTLDTL
jgi:hypothetical protein